MRLKQTTRKWRLSVLKDAGECILVSGFLWALSQSNPSSTLLKVAPGAMLCWAGLYLLVWGAATIHAAYVGNLPEVENQGGDP